MHINTSVLFQSSGALVTLASSVDIGQIIHHSGWFWALVAVFLWGLSMNLTPCVYPMIPITISYFGGTSGEGTSPRSGLLRALLFVIGMAITYSGLGVSAALTGRMFGASLGNPYVIGFVVIVMVAMALSMFGVFQVAAPSSWLNRIGELRDRLGLVGALFFGLVIGIVVAPCVGPFIITLLTYVAATGNPWLGFTLFFTLALGMGTPYIILGAFTAALKTLPRPGTWMVWLEQFFGLLLIGMALNLLKPFISPPSVFLAVMACYVLGAGGWLALRRMAGLRAGFRYVQVGTGVAALVLAASYLRPLSVATLPTPSPSVPLPAASGPASATASRAPVPTTVAWKPYSPKALKAALATGRPVMIDFFATWCAACKELDQKTYTDPSVIAASSRFVCLKADFTENQDPEATRTFALQGLPTVVFLDSHGNQMKKLRVAEFVSPSGMLKRMKEALAAAGTR